MELKDLVLRLWVRVVNMAKIRHVFPEIKDYGKDIDTQVEIDSHYAGYLSRQRDDIARFKRDEGISIPKEFNFEFISGLSNEIKEKLKSIQPKTLGQALRIGWSKSCSCNSHSNTFKRAKHRASA